MVHYRNEKTACTIKLLPLHSAGFWFLKQHFEAIANSIFWNRYPVYYCRLGKYLLVKSFYIVFFSIIILLDIFLWLDLFAWYCNSVFLWRCMVFSFCSQLMTFVKVFTDVKLCQSLFYSDSRQHIYFIHYYNKVCFIIYKKVMIV